eukprot:m.270813 g.270813  ORF g.270813 m.270813 type:complete len:140 (+) comp16265_c1_seq44:1128-1547(+)
MAGLYLISCLLFLSSLDAKSRKHQDPKKLQIGVTRRPQDCQLKTKHGDLISVHYTGYLVQKPRDVLDTSREREPFKFTLGHGQVIQGWDKGLTGMCVGEVRKLVVPHDLGNSFWFDTLPCVTFAYPSIRRIRCSPNSSG